MDLWVFPKQDDAFNRTWLSVLSIDEFVTWQHLLAERTGGNVALKASSCLRSLTIKHDVWKTAVYRFSISYLVAELQSFEDVKIKCMIKIFRGGQGWWHLQTPLPPTNNFCLYPSPVFRCFWKDPLMTLHPPPPHFKHPSLLPPSPSTTPFPP